MTRRRKLVVSVALVIVAVVSHGDPAGGYWLDGPKWRDGVAVMHLQLGSPSNALIDGSTTWGAPAETALAIWNLYMETLQFRVVRESTAGIGARNGINNVFWSSSIYGRSFETYAGYALWWSSGGSISEADVIFNNARSWNSYRGPVRGSIIG